MAIEPANKALIEAARQSARLLNEQANEIETELVRFSVGDRTIEFNIDLTAETVWATQQQIADAFQVARSTVAEHIKNVFKDSELDEKTSCRKFRQDVGDGRQFEVLHYNLDVILAVGYRVNSAKATRFRQWATQTLRAYIVDGFAIDEARLRADPGATNKLAAKLRAIRAEEKNIYASIRDFFKEASVDYDPNSKDCKSFYALLQDKFHYAVSKNTASELIMNRANHKDPNMGIQTFAGNLPTMDEAKIGKNYLDGDELYTMHVLSEQFLLDIQSRALRKLNMTMRQLLTKLDELLKFGDYPVFQGYKDYIKDKAIRHAQAEYARYLVRLKKDDVKKIDKPAPAINRSKTVAVEAPRRP
jgi:hypothetical protein